MVGDYHQTQQSADRIPDKYSRFLYQIRREICQQFFPQFQSVIQGWFGGSTESQQVQSKYTIAARREYGDILPPMSDRSPKSVNQYHRAAGSLDGILDFVTFPSPN